MRKPASLQELELDTGGDQRRSIAALQPHKKTEMQAILVMPLLLEGYQLPTRQRVLEGLRTTRLRSLTSRAPASSNDCVESNLLTHCAYKYHESPLLLRSKRPGRPFEQR